ncbi:MAG: DUF1328 domain-containing protein [Actinobacteria bacterium]|nr:DUF1328 domain-containing protein [Actinomycetota bacterium]
MIIAVVLLVLSVIAGIFGFRGVARAGCLVSRIIFFILIAGFIVTVVLMFVNKHIF